MSRSRDQPMVDLIFTQWSVQHSLGDENDSAPVYTHNNNAVAPYRTVLGHGEAQYKHAS